MTKTILIGIIAAIATISAGILGTVLFTDVSAALAVPPGGGGDPPDDVCEACEIRATAVFDDCITRGVSTDVECRAEADRAFLECVGDVICTPPEEREPVRDNVDVENIKLKNGQFRVIIDNAGIGGTSDVEITWVFNPEKCVLLAAGDVGTRLIGIVPLVNDGALTVPNLPLPVSVPVGHNDVDFAEAILLGVNGDAKDCKIDSKKGEFVAVSTIGMGGPGPLDTSNPTGP